MDTDVPFTDDQWRLFLVEHRRLADIVLGSERHPFEGGGRNEDGLLHAVNRNTQAVAEFSREMRNGGVRVHIPAKVWLPSTIAAASAIIVSVVTAIGV